MAVWVLCIALMFDKLISLLPVLNNVVHLLKANSHLRHFTYGPIDGIIGWRMWWLTSLGILEKGLGHKNMEEDKNAIFSVYR